MRLHTIDKGKSYVNRIYCPAIFLEIFFSTGGTLMLNNFQLLYTLHDFQRTSDRFFACVTKSADINNGIDNVIDFSR